MYFRQVRKPAGIRENMADTGTFDIKLEDVMEFCRRNSKLVVGISATGEWSFYIVVIVVGN